jgi:hypothetical protein
MGPVSGTPTPILNVAGTLVRVSAESTLQAFLFAPNALLTLEPFGPGQRELPRQHSTNGCRCRCQVFVARTGPYWVGRWFGCP